MTTSTTLEPRTATVERATKETQVRVELTLDGTGRADVSTGVGFLDHLLTALARHARWDLDLRCTGDLEVDDHHSAEDCALALGAALDKALADRKGITRFGHAYAPLDEALARVVVDLSGRPSAVVHLDLKRERIGDLATENISHVFISLAMASKTSLHVDVIRGENDRWALERQYRHTYRDTLVGSENLVRGAWWDEAERQSGRAAGNSDQLPRVSVERDVAESLKLTLGDRVTWDVQGVEIETQILAQQLSRESWHQEILIATLTAFEELASPELVPTIKNYVEPAYNQDVRQAALEAWATIRPADNELHEHLERLALSPPYALQIRAIEILGELAVRDAAPLLEQLIALDVDPNITNRARKSLAEVRRIELGPR